MKKIIALISTLVALSTPCIAQVTSYSVQQKGAITSGHVASWAGNNLIQDGGAGGGGTPGGTSGQIQYNNAGAFGGLNAVPVANGGSGYNFPNFYPALNKVLTSTGNAKICSIGDSLTQGFPLNELTAYPAQLSGLLMSQYGIKSQANSFFGNPTVGTADPRVTIGSSWASSSTYVPLGGLVTLTASTSTNALSFLPTTNVDTFKIYYIINSANGVISANVNGGSATTQNTATGTNNGIGSFTVTATLGSNTVNVLWSSGGRVDVVGIEAWDSTQSWVSVLNMGVSGTTSTQWNVSTFAYSPANSAAFTAIGCNLVTIELGVNDEDDAVSESTFIANIQAITSAAQTAGADVLLITHEPSNPSGGGSPIATQYSFVQGERNLAITDNLPLVDLYLQYGSYAAAKPYGVYADAFVHQLPAGYGNVANTILTVISPPKQQSYPFAGVSTNPVTLVTNAVSTALFNLTGTGTGSSYTFMQYNDANGDLWQTGILNSTNAFYMRNNVNGFLNSFTLDTSGNLTVLGQSTALRGLFVFDSTDISLLTLNSALTGSGAREDIAYQGGHNWNVGIGLTGETTYGVDGKYYLLDTSNNLMRFVVDTSGNMGIGITSPAHKLDVIGDIGGTNFDSSSAQSTLAGTTAGKIVSSMPFQGASYKLFVANAAGYENTTATAQTITFPVPFTSTPTISVNDTGLTISATTTTLTITGSQSATHSGNIQVTGN